MSTQQHVAQHHFIWHCSHLLLLCNVIRRFDNETLHCSETGSGRLTAKEQQAAVSQSGQSVVLPGRRPSAVSRRQLYAAPCSSQDNAIVLIHKTFGEQTRFEACLLYVFDLLHQDGTTR